MSEIAIQDLPALPVSVTPMELLQMAVTKGVDIEQLQKLMDLQERWEANEARKAFVVAMSAFKMDPPEIFKTKLVSFQTEKGVTSYKHAPLDHVANQISEAMSKQGLSFRWSTEQTDLIAVTCIITHIQGHSESVTLRAGSDLSGKKNAIQAIGSTVTYLQRYTLLAATGLATQDQVDDDGAGSDPAALVTPADLVTLRKMIAETGTDEAQFCKFLKVDVLGNLPLKQMAAGAAALESKLAAMKKVAKKVAKPEETK